MHEHGAMDVDLEDLINSAERKRARPYQCICDRADWIATKVALGLGKDDAYYDENWWYVGELLNAAREGAVLVRKWINGFDPGISNSHYFEGRDLELYHLHRFKDFGSYIARQYDHQLGQALIDWAAQISSEIESTPEAPSWEA